MLSALTGAQAATVVNNNAAATLIGLNTLAAGREAIISRGQLVEIGGSFRMPDVFEAAGVKLREVGTTNRTHERDYADAIGPDTGLLLRVHPSNFRVLGFTREVGIEELIALGRAHGVPVMDDLGAGALLALPPEPEIAASLGAGADLVTCSGDKLIGGPQSGILLGKQEWIDRVRRNPLFRTLRVDKLTLAALEATLALFLRRDGPGDDHPTLHMLRLDADELHKRADSLRTRIRRGVPAFDVHVARGFSQVGSGSLPGESLPTSLISLSHASLTASTLARLLRYGRPPVYTRIVDDQVCIDPRTLQPGDDKDLIQALKDLA
jgi:L-seryl-tRNA(Ser) seleniumtransferase